MKTSSVRLSAAVLFALTAFASPASAAIWCDGQFQIVNGYPVATPFCENHLLAQVARSYGARTSTDYLANSSSEKQQICNFVGFDSRVGTICVPYGHDGGRSKR